MALTISKITRCFEFHGIRLPDPNAAMSADEAKAFYATQYPELATTVVNGPDHRWQAAVHLRTGDRHQGVVSWILPRR